MEGWRPVVPAAFLVVALGLAGCSALEGPPDNWDSQQACEAANPGRTCGYGRCDVKCGINGGWSGWVPVTPATAPPT